MKKIPALLLALILVFGLGSSALAQSQPIPPLEGVITEVTEDGSLLIDTTSIGPVLVLVNAETTYQGNENLAEGQYIYVIYDGVMTRSLPPQVNAMNIICYLIDGVVTSVNVTENSLLLSSKDQGLVLVHLPQMDTLPKEGDFITVYFNGVMALSYPGQISATKVDIYQKAEGVVCETGEGYFLITRDKRTLRVNTGKASRIAEGMEPGVMVDVFYLGQITKSLPPQVFGSVVEIAPTGD